MKSFTKTLLVAAAAVALASPAIAQTPYGQIDLGAAQPSGNLGSQLVIGARGGLEFNKWFSAELSLSQQFMMPATWLGGVNATEFKATPYVRYAFTPNFTAFAGPQIGVAMLSGPASTNTMVGTYGGTAGIEIKTGWHSWSIVPQYEYTRSMQPAVITGPGYTDYYNNNKFTMGLRKVF